MTDKEKPAMAATKERAYEDEHSHDTPSTEMCQCPQCGFNGAPDLFKPGWTIQLFELITRNSHLGIKQDISAMNIQDARYLYNWLSRQSD